MDENQLKAESLKLNDKIKKLREERVREYHETEQRLRTLEKELQAMEKTDLRENAPYQIAKDEQDTLISIAHILRQRIDSISGDLGTYQPTGKVTLGSTVAIKLLDIDGMRPMVSKTDRIIKIVEHETSNALLGLVAKDSRVGSAILGRRSGDVISVVTMKGCCTYKIEGVY